MQLAAEQEDALPHARMAEAGPSPQAHRVEAVAVVLDGELQPAVEGPDQDLDLAGAGMAADITERLLRDPEKA